MQVNYDPERDVLLIALDDDLAKLQKDLQAREYGISIHTDGEGRYTGIVIYGSSRSLPEGAWNKSGVGLRLKG